jgi:haloalkane dehalogenase
MEILRTPDERFEGLPGYPFAPNYVEIDGDEAGRLRLHYVDEGPRDGRIVLMLHGQPTWSYLYRKMIPVFAQAGYRGIAPDLVGFGRSDKPAELGYYSYDRHVRQIDAFIEALDLRDIHLFCQDWGGMIGLRAATDVPDRFASIVASNTGLPACDDSPPSEGAAMWFAFCEEHYPDIPIGDVVSLGTTDPVQPEVLDGYTAPFPTIEHKAGPVAFPRAYPLTADASGAVGVHRARARLAEWRKPFLTLFSDGDPLNSGTEVELHELVPGAANQPHEVVRGGHFVQEDSGEELARLTVQWLEPQ